MPLLYKKPLSMEFMNRDSGSRYHDDNYNPINGLNERSPDMSMQTCTGGRANLPLRCSGCCASVTAPAWGQPARDLPKEGDYPSSILEAMLQLPEGAESILCDSEAAAGEAASPAEASPEAAQTMCRAFNSSLASAVQTPKVHSRLRALHTKGALCLRMPRQRPPLTFTQLPRLCSRNLRSHDSGPQSGR